jgi:hypothetical protein
VSAVYAEQLRRLPDETVKEFQEAGVDIRF